MSKAVLLVTKADVQTAVGPLQTCAGYEAGCEAAIHFVHELFSDELVEGLLLVDASNAFNNLNRRVVLHNCWSLCPSLAPIITNMYRANSNLFVGGETIYSQEGTTQGDPLAMAMFAIGIKTLINDIVTVNTKQVWYADDAAAGGNLTSLHNWWNKLSLVGPGYGYFVNSSNTWLVMKENQLETATKLFEDTNIKITCEGQCYLGSAIETATFVTNYLKSLVAKWIDEIRNLSIIAESEPQSAYAAFTHGLQNRWVFIQHCHEDTHIQLHPLEDAISTILLPSLTGRDTPNELERQLLSLPARLGGLGIKQFLPNSLISQDDWLLPLQIW